MKRLLLVLAVLVALVVNVSPASSAPAEASSSAGMVRSWITYGPVAEQQYVIKRTVVSSGPAVLFIHGGCWESGDLGVWEEKANELAWAGYMTWNMNYRLAASKPWLDISWDVAEVVKRIVTTPGVTSLSIIGDSAGGHLALEYAIANRGQVNTVAVLSPVTDPAYWRQTSPSWAACFERFVGGSPSQVPQRWVDYSPVEAVRAGRMPPRTYLYGSAADSITPRSQVDRFYAEVMNRGTPIWGAVTSRCQSTYPDHGTRLLPCAWPAIRGFLPRP